MEYLIRKGEKSLTAAAKKAFLKFYCGAEKWVNEDILWCFILIYVKENGVDNLQCKYFGYIFISFF